MGTKKQNTGKGYSPRRTSDAMAVRDSGVSLAEPLRFDLPAEFRVGYEARGPLWPWSVPFFGFCGLSQVLLLTVSD
jgi:hypothetical protein